MANDSNELDADILDAGELWIELAPKPCASDFVEIGLLSISLAIGLTTNAYAMIKLLRRQRERNK